MSEADYKKILDWWRSFAPATESDLDLLLGNFRILFAYNSSKIENSAVTFDDTREIFENGKVVSFTGDPRTLFELQNQKRAYDALKPKIIAKEPLSLAFIKEVHLLLTAGTYDEDRYIRNGERPGEFKRHDYTTGINEVGYPPEEVAPALSSLIDEVAEGVDKDLLITAAYFHALFEFIHPFADGNGRTGRTLLNYLLLIHSHPPIVIFDDDRKVYIEALRAYDEREEITLLCDFLLAQTIKTWQATALDRKVKPGAQKALMSFL
jgi:Fic family protein